MNSKVYKWCAVPLCKNTSITKPNYVFIHVPNKKVLRDKWLKLARRNPNDVVPNSTIYFCEDHFDLPNDMENYMQYHIMGSVSQKRMVPGCIPSKFSCQLDMDTQTSSLESPFIAKRRKMVPKKCKKQLNKNKKKKNTEQTSSKEILCISEIDEEQQLNKGKIEEMCVIKQEEIEMAEDPLILTICGACLAQDRPVRPLGPLDSPDDLALVYSALVPEEENVSSVRVCWQCSALLRRCAAFRRRAARARRRLHAASDDLYEESEPISSLKITKTISISIKPQLKAVVQQQDTQINEIKMELPDIDAIDVEINLLNEESNSTQLDNEHKDLYEELEPVSSSEISKCLKINIDPETREALQKDVQIDNELKDKEAINVEMNLQNNGNRSNITQFMMGTQIKEEPEISIKSIQLDEGLEIGIKRKLTSTPKMAEKKGKRKNALKKSVLNSKKQENENK